MEQNFGQDEREVEKRNLSTMFNNYTELKQSHEALEIRFAAIEKKVNAYVIIDIAVLVVYLLLLAMLFGYVIRK